MLPLPTGQELQQRIEQGQHSTVVCPIAGENVAHIEFTASMLTASSDGSIAASRGKGIVESAPIRACVGVLMCPRRFARLVARSTRSVRCSRYHPAMLDPIDIAFDPPDAETVYGNYLRTCEMLGVKRVSRDRAQELIAQWSAALAADAWNRRYGVQ